MAISTDPAPRLKLLAYAYELLENDLLVNDADQSTRRVASAEGDDTVTVTFDDDSTEDFPRRTVLTIYRQQAVMSPEFVNLKPFIVV